MAQMNSKELTVPEEVDCDLHREPKLALVQAVFAKVAHMTKDIGAIGSRQSYECATVPKWTLEEVNRVMINK